MDHSLSSNMEEILDQLSSLKKSISTLSTRLDQIDGNIVNIEQRFVEVDDRFTDIESNVAKMHENNNSIMNKRFMSLESAIGENSKHLKSIGHKLDCRGIPENASSVNIAFNDAPGDGTVLREIALTQGGECVSYFLLETSKCYVTTRGGGFDDIVTYHHVYFEGEGRSMKPLRNSR